jgi:hypothetical protein
VKFCGENRIVSIFSKLKMECSQNLNFDLFLAVDLVDDEKSTQDGGLDVIVLKTKKNNRLKSL